MLFLSFFSGPGLNLFLRLLDFDIGSFHVDKYNAPGVSGVYGNDSK